MFPSNRVPIDNDNKGERERKINRIEITRLNDNYRKQTHSDENLFKFLSRARERINLNLKCTRGGIGKSTSNNELSSSSSSPALSRLIHLQKGMRESEREGILLF
jgi:hypothetical protein